MQKSQTLEPNITKTSGNIQPLAPTTAPLFDTSDYASYERNDPDEDFIYQDED